MTNPIAPINIMGHRFIFQLTAADGSSAGGAFIDDLAGAIRTRNELIKNNTSFLLWEKRGSRMVLRKSGRLPAK